MPTAEQRRAKRKAFEYTAAMDVGDGRVEPCMIADISDGGARLFVSIEQDTVPERFILWLTKDGKATRKCEVAWRSEGQVGVKFYK
jgi:hypothetical protein